jgi:hypothetical protein
LGLAESLSSEENLFDEVVTPKLATVFSVTLESLDDTFTESGDDFELVPKENFEDSPDVDLVMSNFFSPSDFFSVVEDEAGLDPNLNFGTEDDIPEGAVLIEFGAFVLGVSLTDTPSGLSHATHFTAPLSLGTKQHLHFTVFDAIVQIEFPDGLESFLSANDFPVVCGDLEDPGVGFEAVAARGVSQATHFVALLSFGTKQV